MREIIMMFSLLFSLYGVSQVPLTDDNIHEAVILWLNDQPSAEVTYGHISDWSTTNVTNMSGLFSGFPSFNENIVNWDVSNVTDMSFMFTLALSFNQPIGNWDVSKVTNMSYMFGNNYGETSSFNKPIGDWDVSNVLDMSYMFASSSFNRPIGDWNVSSVTNMSGMFYDARFFNQPIGSWNVSGVNNMVNMFVFATSFDQPLVNWDVSSVTNMVAMFRDATSFNQPIDNWDVSGVTDMNSMFYNTTSFNQPIGNWDVSGVTDMKFMLRNANSLSTDNYDDLLIGWANLSLQPNIEFWANSTAYCNGETARDFITNTYGWSFIDGGLDCSGLSIQESLLSRFSFHSNPVSSSLQLTSRINSSYKLYSALGQVIAQGRLKIGINTIDLSYCNSGIYFLKISTEKGAITKRIIRQ